MNRQSKRTLIVAGLCTVLLIGVVAAAGDPAIEWWVMGGGGGPSSGGEVAISDTLGQPVVGPATGGSAWLQAGYWHREAEKAVVNMTLDSGLTLLAPNVHTIPPTDAESALDEIDRQGGDADLVCRWLGETDAWECHNKGRPYARFPLDFGQGYFVRSTAAAPGRARAPDR